MSETTEETRHLERAIELAAGVDPDSGDLPFGAVVALDGHVLGESANHVGTLVDPTAHAEILALRRAARTLGRPRLSGAVLYSSAEPCPMCLAACLWARIDRVVHAAHVADSTEYGFDDEDFYRQLRLPARDRSLPAEPADPPWRDAAVAVFESWSRGTR
ncbi:MAG TPA: nucleoside deaminase [Actinospica sp.]|nr:nucleoside deaminase [Actinospica sp.]